MESLYTYIPISAVCTSTVASFRITYRFLMYAYILKLKVIIRRTIAVCSLNNIYTYLRLTVFLTQ